MQNRKNNRKRKHARGRKSRNSSIVGISYVRSSSSDQLVTVDFPIKNSKLSLVASASFNNTISVNQASTVLDAEALSIQGKFSGWRVTRITFNIIPLSTTAGSSTFFFSDLPISGTVSGAYLALRRNTYPNSNVSSSGYSMTWRPKDFASLDFNTNNAVLTEPVLNFYAYTDATFGTPIVTSDLWLLTGTVTFQLKGLTN